MASINTPLTIGDTLHGVVMDTAKFGAFVKLPNGKTGLVHISQLSEKYIREVTDVVNVGDNVVVRITAIDERGRIQLSMKTVPPEEAAAAADSSAPPLARAPEHQHAAPAPRPPQRQPQRRDHSDDHEEDNFEKKLRMFIRQSEDRLVDVRRGLDSKRGIKKKKNR